MHRRNSLHSNIFINQVTNTIQIARFILQNSKLVSHCPARIESCYRAKNSFYHHSWILDLTTNMCSSSWAWMFEKCFYGGIWRMSSTSMFWIGGHKTWEYKDWWYKGSLFYFLNVKLLFNIFSFWNNNYRRVNIYNLIYI